LIVRDEVLSLPVIEGIEDCGVLALHVGADACERTHPFRVAKIAAPGSPSRLSRSTTRAIRAAA